MGKILTPGFLYWDGFKYILIPIGNLIGPAGGDLGGDYPDPTVIRINGTSVPAAPSANQVLIATGSNTSTWGQITDARISTLANISGSKIDPNFGSQDIITTGSVSIGYLTVSSLTPAGVVHNSGDGYLSSSLIVNADISAVADIAINKLAIGSAGQVLLNNATPVPTWTTISGDAVISPTGAISNVAIHGSSVPAGGFLITGNVLQVNGTSSLTYGPLNLAGGTDYVTGVLPANNVSNLSGDVTGAINSNTVIALRGNAVEAQSLGSMQDGYALIWVNSDGYWEARPVANSVWGNDLSGSSGAHQYVTSISGHAGGGGAVPLSAGAALTSASNSHSYIDLTAANSAYGYVSLLNTLTINPGTGSGITAINFGGTTVSNSANIQFAANSTGGGSSLYITGQSSSTSGDAGGSLIIGAGSAGDGTGLGGSVSIYTGSGSTVGSIALEWGSSSSLTMTNGTWDWSTGADWIVSQDTALAGIGGAGVSTANMMFSTQAPYTSASTYKSPGNFVVNFPAPVGGGSEGSFQLWRGGSGPFFTMSTNLTIDRVILNAPDFTLLLTTIANLGLQTTSLGSIYFAGNPAATGEPGTWQWFPTISGAPSGQINTIKKMVNNYSQGGADTFTIWTGSFPSSGPGIISYLVEARAMFKNSSGNSDAMGGGTCTALATYNNGTVNYELMSPWQNGTFSGNPVAGGVNMTGEGGVNFSLVSDISNNPNLQVTITGSSDPAVQWMVEITEYLC